MALAFRHFPDTTSTDANSSELYVVKIIRPRCYANRCYIANHDDPSGGRKAGDVSPCQPQPAATGENEKIDQAIGELAGQSNLSTLP
jgi:hypothetical protein